MRDAIYRHGSCQVLLKILLSTMLQLTVVAAACCKASAKHGSLHVLRPRSHDASAEALHWRLVCAASRICSGT